MFAFAVGGRYTDLVASQARDLAGARTVRVSPRGFPDLGPLTVCRTKC